MARARRQPSRRESLTGAVILVLLAGVVAAVSVAQGRYDPARYRGPAPAASAVSVAASDLFGLVVPPDLVPAGPVSRFDAGSLYEKINGKADLYLSAGFVELRCQRFTAGFEACVYEMGSPDGAFSVWSRQRRPGARALEDWPGSAYATENALFMALGSRYLELVAATTEPEGAAARERFARAFSEHLGPPEGDERAVALPREGLRDGAYKLVVDSALGCAALDQVYLGWYDLEGGEVAGFLSERAGAEEAAALARAFGAFLADNGGVALSEAQRGAGWPEGAAVWEVEGYFSVVWSRGARLLGVYEAESLALARELTGRMEASP